MRTCLVFLMLLGGCSLYWGDGHGDDVCNEAGGGALKEPAQGFVDPSTGQCSYYGGGGTCGGCGPCAEAGGEAIAEPDWASCYSACSGLSEDACLSTAGCHADYTVQYTPGGPQDTFWACVNLPPSGAIEGGGCANLDAQTCSEHDDCVSDYTQDSSGTTAFASCDPETPSACLGLDCGPGYHCDEECTCSTMDNGSAGGCSSDCKATCVPDQTCATVDCGPGYQCAMECSSGTCYPTCEPVGVGPGSCTGTVTCNLAPPVCPVNTTAGIDNGCYTGYCIPNSKCGTTDPGKCYAQVTCNSAPPHCPSGTLPGVVNGCYSGYCIPTNDCEMAACETITNESSCEARMDCIPVYNGTDCTCTPSGCTCATLTWERCESAVMPL